MAIILTGSRVISLSLKTLKRESPDPCSHETGALCFAVDESGDRLAIGGKRRVTLVKRVPGTALQGARFEQLHTMDIGDSLTISDVCFAVENGQRWLCVLGKDGTMWLNTEQHHHHHQQQPLSSSATNQASAASPLKRSSSSGGITQLPSADLVAPGRKNDEVILCRQGVCTFTSPFQERAVVHFSSAVSQIVLLNPYVIGLLRSGGKVEIRLDDGQLVQSLDFSGSFLELLRWTAMPYRDPETHSRGIIACAGADPRRRVFFRICTPLRNQVSSLIASSKFASAVSLVRGLLRLESHWDSPLTDEDDGEAESDHRTLLALYDESRFEYAISLLLTRPVCSAEEINSAALLLGFFPSHPNQDADTVRLSRFLLVFADTDLFDSIDSAKASVRTLLQSKPHTAVPDTNVARFRPGGALSVAMRNVVVPVLLRLRRGVQQHEEQDRLRLLDSLLLRAFVLGRPGRNAVGDQKFETEKRLFLKDNQCEVAESERLLLSFPEMWEDHAALLAGKGEFEKGLEWLRVLGVNAPQDDVRKYAQASSRMLEERPDLAMKYSRWMLDRCPPIGAETLVSFNCFEVDSSSSSSSPKPTETSLTKAKTYFSTEFPDRHQELYRLYLEKLVDSFRGKVATTTSVEPPPSSAVEELASIYLSDGNGEAFVFLVQLAKTLRVPASALLALLPRLDDWPREQAQVLDFAGRRREAAYLLATRCSREEAESYARSVKDEENVFDLVLDGLLSRGGGNSDEDDDADGALRFLVRNVDSMDAGRALKALPDRLDLESCMELVRVALGDRESGHRDHQVMKQLLRRENFMARERLAMEKAKYVLVGMDSPACVGCRRTFKAENPMIVFQSHVWHYACFRQANPEY